MLDYSLGGPRRLSCWSLFAALAAAGPFLPSSAVHGQAASASAPAFPAKGTANDTADAAAGTAAAGGPRLEALRMRVEALGADPSVAGLPVADALFLIRFYERRQFSLAWNSPAKLDALIAVLEGSERHGLVPADYHLDAIAAHLERAARAADELYFLPDVYGRDPALLRALDAEFEFVPPAGYEESLSRVSSP